MMKSLIHDDFRTHNRTINDLEYIKRLNKIFSRYKNKLFFATNDYEGNFKGFITARNIKEALHKAEYLGVRLHYAPNRKIYPVLYQRERNYGIEGYNVG